MSERVVDPVCGMTVTAEQAPFSRQHQGNTYFLCSAECDAKFRDDGDAYATVARLNLPGWGLTPEPESVTRQRRRPPD